MNHQFLIHNDEDNVGVAVVDINKGENLRGVILESNKTVDIKALEEVPLSHKIATKNLNLGDKVSEYNVVIGKAIEDIAKGEQVHVHNIKSMRWQND